jgi:hypothetical protein
LWIRIDTFESKTGEKMHPIRAEVPEPLDESAADELEALLLEGLHSGPATPFTPDDWDDIRRDVHKFRKSVSV